MEDDRSSSAEVGEEGVRKLIQQGEKHENVCMCMCERKSSFEELQVEWLWKSGKRYN